MTIHWTIRAGARDLYCVVQTRFRAVAHATWRQLAAHPKGVLATFGVLAVASVPALFALEFDLSFRPLFSEDAALRAKTDEMSVTFGPLGTGSVGILVEADDVLRDDILRATADLSRALKARDDVSRVLSPTNLPRPGEGPDALTLLPSCEDLRAGDLSCRESLRRIEMIAPRPFALLVAKDHQHLVVWVDIDAGVFDLATRRRSVVEIEALVARHLAPVSVRTTLVGYSVVEVAYESLLIRGAALAAVATLLMIALVLLLLFRDPRAVIAALVGVGVGLPLSLAAMAAMGWPVTLVSASLPTLLLMIGVADSIHLVHTVQHSQKIGISSALVVEDAWLRLLRPCAFTTLTTAIGFGTLLTAGLSITRDFGAAAATGVVIVHICNALVVPAFLLLWPVRPRTTMSKTTGRWSSLLAAFVVRRAGMLSIAGGVVLAASMAFAMNVALVQSFNQDVAKTHPLRRAQQTLETHFPGFLGPDVMVRRKDHHSLMTEEDLVQIHRLAQRLQSDADVTRVLAVTDILDMFVVDTGTDVSPILWPMVFEQAKQHALQSDSTRAVLSLLDDTDESTVLMVRTTDLGTQKAAALIARVEQLSTKTLGEDYEVSVGGYWVQAQTGMRVLVADLFHSFCLAFVLILPFLWWGARSWRLLLLAVLPNVAPLVLVLGAMVVLNIPLRIGTAIVCAVALGIAVDDTIHLLHAFRAGERQQASSTRTLAEIYRTTGATLLTTSLVLSVGFLSLSIAHLQVMTDMGVLGAIVMAAALVFDGLWLPALWSWRR